MSVLALDRANSVMPGDGGGYGYGGGARATKALTQLMENLKADVVGVTGLVFNTDLTMEGRVTAGADKLAELHALSDKLADAASEDAAA